MTKDKNINIIKKDFKKKPLKIKSKSNNEQFFLYNFMK